MSQYVRIRSQFIYDPVMHVSPASALRSRDRSWRVRIVKLAQGLCIAKHRHGPFASAIL